MPFETQVCLKLFDNLKVGLLFKYLLHIHTDANQILSERYWKTLFEQMSIIFKTNDNPGRNQIMNIAHRRPIAFKISENDLWYFFFNSNKFYLCPLVEKSQRIKVSYFEDFMHH